MGIPSTDPTAGVIIPPKNAFKSLTFVVNGVIFGATAIISIYDLLTGANLLIPIVSVFTKDPTRIALVLNFLVQIYSFANILLRFRSKQGITLSK